MRPLEVELEGFSAYRQRVKVDFRDVDFFSLTGPTGSGKSSLIDAMVFALFGRVPRLGGNAVAPAITAGSDRARVRLDFEVDDQTYTTVRLAQRTPTGGATVKEARLEQGDVVIADGADDVTAAVEELLRLRFDDFTRTVVLPQGEFARFLTATKSERQGLLRNLLGLEVYTRVRELAKRRAAVAGERLEGATRALESLELADEKDMREAVERRDRLAALSESITGRTAAISVLDAAVADVESRSLSLAEAIERVISIQAPPRLAELDTLLAGARSSLIDAEEARARAADELGSAESAMTELPGRDRVSAWRRSWERLADLEARLADSEIETASSQARETAKQLEEGITALEEVRNRLDRARDEHAAHLLTATLTVGEACPVCDQEVTRLPDRAAQPDLDDMQAEENQLADAVEALRSTAESARTELTRLETSRAGLDEQRGGLLAELEDAPSVELLDGMESEVLAAGLRLENAKEWLTELEIAEKTARKTLEDLADDSRRVSKLLTAAQLKVADLDPPVPESDDVVVQWKEMEEWRAGTLETLHGDQRGIQDELEEARSRASAARHELIHVLEAHGIEPEEPYVVRVATAWQAARAQVDAQEKAARDALALKSQVAGAEEERAVAESLAGHLRANGFEQWLMAGALTDLVSGANDLLGQLSGGGHSLHSDDSGSFSIVDHRNADEMRSVATLSGGETFLVSLALALSLAETLAAKGGSGLDAIILDEGFGALDGESLDIVASVLEELTGRGLMVGIITHIKELAARAAVRYEVRREPGGAMVRLAS